MSYQLGHEWEHERARLSRLEQGMDPGTLRALDTIGVKPGWRCLEVGGGGGSIAAWLAGAVGTSGEVLATDLQTSFMDALDIPGLTVQTHNIVTDPLPENHYDLIHARAVLEHVPEREAALAKMVKALKPGGWLALEGHDFSALQHISGGTREDFDTACAGMIAVFQTAGFDPAYGRLQGQHMKEAGLEVISAEGRAYELGGDRPLTPVLSLVLERFKEPIVASGVMSTEKLEAVISGLNTGTILAMSPMVVAAIGRKPL